jgi:hypothetical protein
MATKFEELLRASARRRGADLPNRTRGHVTGHVATDETIKPKTTPEPFKMRP